MKVFIVLVYYSDECTSSYNEPDCICATEQRAKDRIKTLRGEYKLYFGYDADDNKFSYEEWPVL